MATNNNSQGNSSRAIHPSSTEQRAPDAYIANEPRASNHPSTGQSSNSRNANTLQGNCSFPGDYPYQDPAAIATRNQTSGISSHGYNTQGHSVRQSSNTGHRSGSFAHNRLATDTHPSAGRHGTVRPNNGPAASSTPNIVDDPPANRHQLARYYTYGTLSDNQVIEEQHIQEPRAIPRYPVERGVSNSATNRRVVTSRRPVGHSPTDRGPARAFMGGTAQNMVQPVSQGQRNSLRDYVQATSQYSSRSSSLDVHTGDTSDEEDWV